MNNILDRFIKCFLMIVSAFFIISCGGSGGGGSSSITPVTPTSYPVVIQNSPGGSTNIIPGGSATFNIGLNPNSTMAKKLKSLTSGGASYTVKLSLQNAPSGIALSTSQIILTDSSPNSSFTVNVALSVTVTNPNQGIAIVADVNGQTVSYPLAINIVKPGTLAFTNSTSYVNVLLGSTQQVTLALTPVDPASSPSVTANIASNSTNLQVTPTQCILNSSNLACTVTLIPNGVVGSYQISATAQGYNTQSLTVAVTLPGSISFDSQAVNMLTSATHTVNLSLSNSGASDPAQTLYLSTTGGTNLKVSPSSCILSYATPSCAVTVASNGVAGSYNLLAQANGVTLAPVSVTTSNPGSIVFQQESAIVVGSHGASLSGNIALNMVGASTTLQPVKVTLTTDNESAIWLQTGNVGYLCGSNDNPTCNPSVNVAYALNESGVFHIYANAASYPQQIFTIYAYSAPTLQFVDDQWGIFLWANGQPYTTTLKLVGAVPQILPLTVVIKTSLQPMPSPTTEPTISHGSITTLSPTPLTVSPSTCTFTNQNLATGCQITITPELLSPTADYNITASGGVAISANLLVEVIGITPNPYPSPMSYQPMPNGFESALPSFITPITSSTGLQIAYGYNTNPEAPNLVAYINQLVTSYTSPRTYICSATPVASDGHGGTWLVGAAHCFLSSKALPATVSFSDILPVSNLSVKKGIYGADIIASTAQVFVQKDYCKGSTFSILGECPNLLPENDVVGSQGNDIALIHINSKFNSNEAYPQLARAESYPQPYTMAPVLSMGFGDNNVNGGNGDLFYVVNYFYQQSDKTGYHYLYNSYFNPDPSNFGYSTLFCGGDSGGPDLFWNGSNWLLLSEHTYYPVGACGQFFDDLPNGATNVSAYYDWLTSIIGATNPTAYCSNESANCVTNGS